MRRHALLKCRANFFKMETRTFKIDNYITVPGFAIVELGLSGNELLCYSLIYGFTQDKETEFRGSLNYVASALNVTKQNAKKIIDRLINRKLIDKREMYFSGVKFCRYVANRYSVADLATACYQNSNGGVAEIATGDVADSATNNNKKDNSLDINKDNADGGLFPGESGFVPVVVTRPRRTSEPICLFADSRFADYEKFAAEFDAPEFDGIDLVYYFHAVADWSSRNGKKQKDWIATARNFMRNDKRDGKLVKVSTDGGALSPDAVQYLSEMAQ